MAFKPAETIRLKRYLKAYAHSHGIPVPKGFGWAVPKVGRPCRILIGNVQHKAFGAKHVTRVFDERTRNLILPKAPVKSLGEQALDVARTYIGVHESGSPNAGAMVHVFQSSTGMYNQAWCASFVSYCLRKVGYKGSVTAGAWAWLAYGQAIPSRSMKAGDLAIYSWGDGHIGFFERWIIPGVMFSAVEGNTSDAVLRRTRYVTQLRGARRIT